MANIIATADERLMSSAHAVERLTELLTGDEAECDYEFDRRLTAEDWPLYDEPHGFTNDTQAIVESKIGAYALLWCQMTGEPLCDEVREMVRDRVAEIIAERTTLRNTLSDFKAAWHGIFGNTRQNTQNAIYRQGAIG